MQAERPKSETEQFDRDGVELIERPKQFAKLLRLLDDRGAVTVGTSTDPRLIRVTLLKVTP
jgi:hypothetical protein